MTTKRWLASVSAAVCGVTMLCAADRHNLTPNAHDLIKENAFELSVPAGWSRMASLPPGMDAGFSKNLKDGQMATFLLHYEMMPRLAGGPPLDTSGISRQWDLMIHRQYSDVTSLNVAKPKVQGKILLNCAYTMRVNSLLVKQHYTYFLVGRTAFVVRCVAPPSRWSMVQDDFDSMLASLRPRSTASKLAAVSDSAVIKKLKRIVPLLLRSWPSAWECSVTVINITDKSLSGKVGRRTLDITLSFRRNDIAHVYDTTKQLFGMMKAGNSDEELHELPNKLRDAMADSTAFIKYVGEVWGYAHGQMINCSPPIERYRIIITDSAGRRIGSISVSKESVSAILSGNIEASEAKKLAGMYVFE